MIEHRAKLAIPPGTYVSAFAHAYTLTCYREGDAEFCSGLGSVTHVSVEDRIGIVRIEPGFVFSNHTSFTRAQESITYAELIAAVDRLACAGGVDGILIRSPISGGQLDGLIDAGIAIAAANVIKPLFWEICGNGYGAALFLAAHAGRVYARPRVAIDAIETHTLTPGAEILRGDPDARDHLRTVLTEQRRLRPGVARRLIDGTLFQNGFCLGIEARKYGLVDELTVDFGETRTQIMAALRQEIAARKARQ